MTEPHRWPTVREMMAETDRGLLDDPAAFVSGFTLNEPAGQEAAAEGTRPQPAIAGEDPARRKDTSKGAMPRRATRKRKARRPAV